MLTGATCNGSCECANENGGDDGCTKVISLGEETDCFFVYNQLPLECTDGKCLCTDRFYQRFTNVCRRDSMHNEAPGNGFIDYSIELNSIGAESNCTSVGTQTHSRDANIQTTESLDSITTPSELNDKFSEFSSRRVRNYINYNRLDNSDCTKAESSLESSVKDESTQFGESGESENKSYSGNKCYNNKKFFCHCQDPFYPKAELKDLVVEDEIYFENGHFNPKTHRCICKTGGDHLYHDAEIRQNYLRRQQLGLNSLFSQPNQYAMHALCPCYNFTKYNNFTTNTNNTEPFTKKFNESFKVKSRDSLQRHTCECKLNFNAQQHDTEATQMQHENDSLRNDNNSAFENTAAAAADSASYKVEMLNEKMKRNQFTDNFVAAADRECLEKESDDGNFLEENEQSKPLLGGEKMSDVKNGDKVNSSSSDSIAVANGEKDNSGEVEANAGHGCHCHHHHHDNSPESNNNQNCIRVRPSKKSSKSTSPLKIITLLLFASAFLITGSAIRDAYYP